MKQVLIIGGLSKDTDHTDYETEFSKFLPHQFSTVRFDQLAFRITASEFSIKTAVDGREISSFDLIMFRGKIRKQSGLAYVISKYLANNKVEFFNDYSNYRPSSKLAQALLFYELQLPFIDTCFSLDPEVLVKLVRETFSYPIILKDSYGSHGNNNHLVQSEDELKMILARDIDVQYLAQRYIENDGDYRILVAGDVKPLQIKRTAVSGSHLNNTSQGAEAELVESLPQEIIDQAQLVCKELKMTLAGVDVLQASKGGSLYFLEVNSQPQLLSGAYLPEKKVHLARLLDSLLN